MVLSRQQPVTTLAFKGSSALPVQAEVVEGCRAATLYMGGPRIRMLGVTSAERGEGRTTVALGMAAVQQKDYGHSAFLVDLDLDTAGLTRRLDVAIWPGLCEVVRGEAQLDEVIVPVGEGIALLPAGSAGADGPRIMVELNRVGLVEQICRLDATVIVDLPPLFDSTIGRAAAATCDELLLVVRSGATSVGRVQKALDDLGTEPRVLLNGTSTALPRWLQRFFG